MIKVLGLYLLHSEREEAKELGNELGFEGR